MNRRKLISAICVGSIASLAGCNSDEAEELPIELRPIVGLNWSTEVNTLQIRVILDNEVIKESTCELKPDEECVLDCTWPSDPGNFAIAARLERDTEWTESDLTEFDADCASPTVMIRDEGDIDIPVITDCNPSGVEC